MSYEAEARFLLFLPPVVGTNDLPAYKDAYHETVSEVLKEVASQSRALADAAILEIAFACQHLVDSDIKPRAQIFHKTQESIALLYKLVVLIAAQENIDIEDNTGVDVRVIPVAWDAEHSPHHRHAYTAPVVDITTLATSKRVWSHAFAVESAAGEAMVRAFINAKKEPADNTNTARPDLTDNAYHYSVAVGGTFDHLHIGHKLLLTMTLFAVDQSPAKSSLITIGLTGDELLKNKKFAEVLESWPDREKAVESFCDSLMDFTNWPSTKTVTNRDEPVVNGKSVDWQYASGLAVRCTQIQDPFGPTITDKEISAIVLSAETRAGGEAINKKRSEHGWNPLEVFEVDVLDAEDDGVTAEGFDAKLSSTAIRKRLASKKPL